MGWGGVFQLITLSPQSSTGLRQKDQNTHMIDYIVQDWVAFMSQPYWVEVKVEVELRLILRLKLI